MPTLNTVVVGTGQPATLIYGAQGSQAAPIQVVNLDTENTVILCYNSNMQGTFPLGPLASMAFDSSVGLYGVAQNAPIELGVTPGGSNYSAGSLTITGPVTAEITGPVTVSGTVDVAGTTDVSIQNANIDVVGAGGFITPGQVNSIYTNTGALTVPPSSTTGVNQWNVSTYSSIVFSVGSISNSSTANGAAVCEIFQLVWTDASGNILAYDTLSCIAGGATTWEVPVKGAFLGLNIQNPGTVGTLTIAVNGIFIDGSYRVIPNIRAVNTLIQNTIVLPGCLVQPQSAPVYRINSWVASISYTWSGANANVVFPLPQCAGQVTGMYQIITTALVKNATIVDLTYAVQGAVISGASYVYGIILSIPNSIDSNPVPLSINLPPTQCAVIIDTPSTGGTFDMSLIGIGN